MHKYGAECPRRGSTVCCHAISRDQQDCKCGLPLVEVQRCRSRAGSRARAATHLTLLECCPRHERPLQPRQLYLSPSLPSPAHGKTTVGKSLCSQRAFVLKVIACAAAAESLIMCGVAAIFKGLSRAQCAYLITIQSCPLHCGCGCCM